jgi:hypothetical protein
VKHPRRYALFFGEEEEAYFAGTAAECKQYIRESGTRRGWHDAAEMRRLEAAEKEVSNPLVAENGPLGVGA